MIRRSLLAVLLSLSPLALPAAGPVNMVSTDVVVPSAGRGPGAAGSFWTTDLWVRCPDQADVRLDFYALDAASGDPAATATVHMTQPVLYLADVIHGTLGMDTAFGNLRVRSDRPVSATVRVSTQGGGGSYGMGFMGMPSSMSMGSSSMMGSDDSHRFLVQGLLPQPQARVNVMIANTGPTAIHGTCDVLDADGGTPSTGAVSMPFTIQPYSGHQFNDVLQGVHSRFDDTGLQLRMALDDGSSGTMMTLATVVDNVTNDGYVLMGTMMDTAGAMMGR
jgi:hypothetical protein